MFQRALSCRLDDRAIRHRVREWCAQLDDIGIIARVTPEDKVRLVQLLQREKRIVAMTGDGVNDVLSLKRSNLAIAMGSGTQAARGVADLILIDDGFSALASAIGEGQRILNGMQDILRVFLTRILTLGMLILVLMTSGFFPVDLRNASAITLFTVGIPTALLAIWSRPGPFLGESLLRTLAKFVLPAASLASIVGLLVVTGVFLVGGLEDHVTGKVDRIGIVRRDEEGSLPVESILKLRGRRAEQDLRPY